MAGGASQPDSNPEDVDYDTWYAYGVRILYVEMVIATFVTIYSLYLAFTGSGGLGAH